MADMFVPRVNEIGSRTSPSGSDRNWPGEGAPHLTSVPRSVRLAQVTQQVVQRVTGV